MPHPGCVPQPSVEWLEGLGTVAAGADRLRAAGSCGCPKERGRQAGSPPPACHWGGIAPCSAPAGPAAALLCWQQSSTTPESPEQLGQAACPAQLPLALVHALGEAPAWRPSPTMRWGSPSPPSLPTTCWSPAWRCKVADTPAGIAGHVSSPTRSLCHRPGAGAAYGRPPAWRRLPYVTHASHLPAPRVLQPPYFVVERILAEAPHVSAAVLRFRGSRGSARCTVLPPLPCRRRCWRRQRQQRRRAQRPSHCTHRFSTTPAGRAATAAAPPVQQRGHAGATLLLRPCRPCQPRLTGSCCARPSRPWRQRRCGCSTGRRRRWRQRSTRPCAAHCSLVRECTRLRPPVLLRTAAYQRCVPGSALRSLLLRAPQRSPPLAMCSPDLPPHPPSFAPLPLPPRSGCNLALRACRRTGACCAHRRRPHQQQRVNQRPRAGPWATVAVASARV